MFVDESAAVIRGLGDPEVGKRLWVAKTSSGRLLGA